MSPATQFMLDLSALPPEFYADPYLHFHDLREKDPVHWSETLQCWMITRYDDVVAVLKDWRHYSSVGQVSGLIDRMPESERKELCPMHNHFSNNGIINSDPPQHTRLRTAVNRAFVPPAIESLRPGIEQIVNDLLDALDGRTEFDLVADFAYLLPSTVISKMLGVPVEDRVFFNIWVDEINDFLGGQKPELAKGLRAQESLMKLREYYQTLRETRRAEPREDLLSWLNSAQENGEIASDGEFLVTCVTLLTAGYETTMSLIGNSIYTLLNHPGQLERLRQNSNLTASAVEELLRFESPVQRRVRTVLEDTELGGRAIRKGQIVVTLLGAANRDPEHFDDPDLMNLERANNNHIAFGISRHLCVGAPLARLEGQIAINAILDRYPNLRLADKTARWRQNALLRGLTALPVAV